MSPDTQTADVLDLLKAQHREVDRLLDEVAATGGDRRRDAFQCLVRLLAVHETAEEQVVHPIARDAERTADVVEPRLREESEAKRALYELERLDPESAEFGRAFTEFAGQVRAHAAREEQTEFPLIAAGAHTADRQRLRSIVEVAERTAPTHPHPHAPMGAAGSLAVGPFVAIADRVRDAISGPSRT